MILSAECDLFVSYCFASGLQPRLVCTLAERVQAAAATVKEGGGARTSA